jgi:hypothetical protein
MKISSGTFYILILFGMVALGCLDPYTPPTSSIDTNFLVIDGHINASSNLATVRLSRAIEIANNSEYPQVTGASVTIEDNDSSLIPLSESEDGVYVGSSNFSMNQKYQLTIELNGSVYRSSFITLVKNAPIDSLSWSVENDALEVRVNTHDFSQDHSYYLFSGEETHEYTAPFFSFFKYENGAVDLRYPSDYIYACWITHPASSNMLLASTENLTKNILTDYKVLSIQKGDRRLWRRYSLLVNQKALTKEAYDYWSQIKKVSESLGGLSDPLPYPVDGNIKSETNPDETVLGYFYGGEVTQKRVVVGNMQLPIEFTGTYVHTCVEDYVPVGNIRSLEGKDVILTRAQYVLTSIVGYYYSTPQCVDCRLQGGTNVKPDFMN